MKAASCLLVCLSLPLSLRADALRPFEHLYWLLPGALDEGHYEQVRTLLRERAPQLPFEAYALAAGEEGRIGDPTMAISLANRLEQEFPGKLVFGTAPVGTEGWETSCHPRRADPSLRMSQEQWLQVLAGVRASKLALVFSHLAVRQPDPAAVARHVARFARFCHEHDRECFVWFSAQMLRRGDERLAQAIVAAAGADIDHYVWMDAPGMIYATHEFGLQELLGKLVAITPPDKTVIQFIPNPHHISSPQRATEYLCAAQQQGIRSAAVLGRIGNLDQPAWREFYMTLPRRQ